MPFFRARFWSLGWACTAWVLSAGGSLAAESGAPIDGLAPVSVSSANYRRTTREVLLNVVEAKSTVNPTPAPAPARPAEPVHYVFLPGEIYPTDLKWEDVSQAVATSLLHRGFVHAVDPTGRIREPKKVTLVLRLSYGVRTWRRPLVRTESLAWEDGLEPRPTGRGLHTLGGDVVFEDRAGGNDQALAAAVANASNTSSLWGGGGGAADQSAAMDSGVAALNAYESTRDFNLVVVDAFSYAELKTKGRHAERLWTTFLSAPVERGKSFAQVLPAMLRLAQPYWAETTSGLQIFQDARAEVRVGEAVVVGEPDRPGSPK